jgi:phosphatidylglycerophosphate synthase
VADTGNRRPIKQRGSAWAQWLAAWMADGDVNPNLVSASSGAFALLGAALLLAAGGTPLPLVRAALFIGAGACIQLRLVCNLLDGMVAVEHGRGSSSGPIWNELPDRLSDVVLLVAAGYCARLGGSLLFTAAIGWTCAVLALSTAYIRELGRGLGFPADFSGPFAKQQRMMALTAAALVSAAEPLWGWHGLTMLIALVIIAFGTLATAARRTATLARRLSQRFRENGGNE